MAIFPKGSLLQAGDVATATNFVTIPGVRTISLSGLVADTLDATSHDTASGFRDKMQGLKDWGQVTFECLWEPANVTHAQAFTDFKAGTERYYLLTIKQAGVEKGTFQFKAFVNDYPFTVPFDALLTLQVALTIKGDPEPVLEAS